MTLPDTEKTTDRVRDITLGDLADIAQQAGAELLSYRLTLDEEPMTIVIYATGDRARDLDEFLKQLDKEEMQAEDDAELNATGVQTALCLVDLVFPLHLIEGWSHHEQRLAFDWAMSCHLQASDNNVEVPPKPAFLNRIKAPWPDSQGHSIHDGDIIKHPDGLEGIVMHLPNSDPNDVWRVQYGDGTLSRLCEAGQAVVVKTPREWLGRVANDG